MTRKTTLSALALGAALLLGPAVADASDEVLKQPGQATRAVDLAICLDTSGSMDGLIDAARQKLWGIVNDLALAKPTPDLRVALMTFGNDGHAAEAGWVLRQTDFTSDLDTVSDKLFKLTTNGGTELVGRVLQGSLDQLTWSKDPKALKLIVVAGNESADQDKQVGFREVCKRAITSGVMVNSIYCGNPADEMAPAWREVATLADGHFAAIETSDGAVVIATPFDARLAALSGNINKTYIPYGDHGWIGCENQKAQDKNAAGASPSAVAGRAVSKGGQLYRNGNWDLVDACKDKEFKLEDIKDEDLPEDMRKMTLEQRKAHVKSKLEEREKLRKQIADLGKERGAFIETERRKRAEGLDEKSFDFAVRKAIREQAKAKGFTF